MKLPATIAALTASVALAVGGMGAGGFQPPSGGGASSGGVTPVGNFDVIDAGVVYANQFLARAASGSRAFDPLVEGARVGVGPDTYFVENGTQIHARAADGLFVEQSAEFAFIGTTDGLVYSGGAVGVRAGAATRVLVSSTAITAQGSVKYAAPNNAGTCTLNGGTPATCTATVTASAVCVCSPVGTTSIIAAAGCAVSLASTTLTLTGGAAATNNVNYWCDR